jgi:hypothetical protein
VSGPDSFWQQLMAGPDDSYTAAEVINYLARGIN